MGGPTGATDGYLGSYQQAEKATEPVWIVSCMCLPAGAGREGIVAYHVDGEKRLTVQEIEQWLANLEQARYQIASLEAAMTEAGLEIEHPWERV